MVASVNLDNNVITNSVSSDARKQTTPFFHKVVIGSIAAVVGIVLISLVVSAAKTVMAAIIYSSVGVGLLILLGMVELSDANVNLVNIAIESLPKVWKSVANANPV